ncbi:hypothetical protein H6F43_05040 [Leptolyngbya sp. FACHB-36]|nr:hypothetical protein [Leptolyngbya sp. FACHB-36]
MNTMQLRMRKKLFRGMSYWLSLVMAVPLLASCGSGANQANLPPVDESRTRTASPAPQQAQKRGLNTGQKVAILAGAAALYYLYNRHKNRQSAGAEGKYYLSKNGRIYYRDAQGRAHWVTPPKEGIRVPAEEAERYQEFQGYNGRTTGRDLSSLPEARQAPSQSQQPYPLPQ